MIAASFSKESESYRPCNEINQEGGHLCESPIWLRIDVNGLKGPNTLGRDVLNLLLVKMELFIQITVKNNQFIMVTQNIIGK